MADKEIQGAHGAIEAVVTKLGDLEAAFGPSVRPVLSAVRARLIAAMAARDRGEMPMAIAYVGTAMDELATYAEKLDPNDGEMMRAVARSLRLALLRGDQPGAKESAAVMLERSGATERKRTR